MAKNLSTKVYFGNKEEAMRAFSLLSLLVGVFVLAAWLGINTYPMKTDVEDVTSLGWPMPFLMEIHAESSEIYGDSKSGIAYYRHAFIYTKIRYQRLAVDVLCGVIIAAISGYAAEKILRGRRKIRMGS